MMYMIYAIDQFYNAIYDNALQNMGNSVPLYGAQ
jgi:hypothetical protein